MPIYRRDRSPYWWIDLRHPRGGRIRRSTGTADREAAQRQHDTLAARLWQVKQTGRQLSDALLTWATIQERGGSDIRMLRQIRAHYPDRPLIDVTEASFIDVFGEKSPGTYNRLAAIVRASMKLAEQRGWIERAPTIKRRKEPPAIERYLTAEEWTRLRAELADHLRPMADFAIATGLRWSNVAGMEWKRVDLRRRVAWIGADEMKGRKGLAVPLNATAIAALRATGRGREGFVFTYNGRPLGSPKKGFAEACRRADVKDATWHDLRRTWASWHTMNGTPPDALQKLGGWATRDMLDVYARLAPSYLAQFAGNSRPVRRKKAA